RREAEALAGVADVRAIEPLDESLDARPGLPGRARQAAREEHVVLGLEALQLRLERGELTTDLRRLLGHCGYSGTRVSRRSPPARARCRRAGPPCPRIPRSAG